MNLPNELWIVESRVTHFTKWRPIKHLPPTTRQRAEKLAARLRTSVHMTRAARLEVVRDQAVDLYAFTKIVSIWSYICCIAGVYNREAYRLTVGAMDQVRDESNLSAAEIRAVCKYARERWSYQFDLGEAL